MNTNHETVLDNPTLPYAGSSGYAGSETSRHRAEVADEVGMTLAVQNLVLELLYHSAYEGLTIAEIRVRIHRKHHGSLSSALSTLHKGGKIERLAQMRVGGDSRFKCKIYVDPRYTDGRETEEQGFGPSEMDLLLDEWFAPQPGKHGEIGICKADQYRGIFIAKVRALHERTRDR